MFSNCGNMYTDNHQCRLIYNEEKEESGKSGKKIFSLLKNKSMLIYFSIIVLIVGFEIGLMTATPKYLLERCNVPIERGGLGCSLYYAARTIGTLIGSILLVRISSRKFLITTMLFAISAFSLIMLTDYVWVIMTDRKSTRLNSSH